MPESTDRPDQPSPTHANTRNEMKKRLQDVNKHRDGECFFTRQQGATWAHRLCQGPLKPSRLQDTPAGVGRPCRRRLVQVPGILPDDQRAPSIVATQAAPVNGGGGTAASAPVPMASHGSCLNAIYRAEGSSTCSSLSDERPPGSSGAADAIVPNAVSPARANSRNRTRAGLPLYTWLRGRRTQATL